MNWIKGYAFQFVDETHTQMFEPFGSSGAVYPLTLPPATYRISTTDRLSDGSISPYKIAEVSPVTLSVGEQKTIEIKLTLKNPPTPTPTPTPTKTPTPSPSCKLSKSSGVVGSSVSVSCSGFRAKESITSYWDTTASKSIGSVTTDSKGAAKFTIKIPAGAAGSHKLIAHGALSRKSLSLSYKVLPALAISPTSGYGGSTVTVTLTGFGAGEKVAIRWYDVRAKSYKTVKTVTVSKTGSATTTFKISTSEPKGSHQVRAVGSSHVATASFTVKSR